jgi:regulator of nucleoside diphosphate kinase
MLTQVEIVMTDQDRARLAKMMRAMRTPGDPYRQYLRQLEAQIGRAKAVTPDQLPADVVTMNSRVRVRDLDSDEISEFTLVYHLNGSAREDCVSILAPLGTALLGTREGDEVEWPVPAGVRRLRVEQTVYQPEAAGEVDL